MNIAGIIPARYASTRFPGKPLAIIGGKSMIERVYRQSELATGLSSVAVATDDERIYKHVRGFGGNVYMTSDKHRSGTDRCAEASGMLKDDPQAVINIQGDEPFIQPDQINSVCALLAHAEIATLVKRITAADELFNPNVVKAVVGRSGKALFFSRQAIPFYKGADPQRWPHNHIYYKHIGIYGYRTEVLKKLTALSPGLLEQAESLEQLRWLENGYSIMTHITEHETAAVDTPEDLVRLQHGL